MLRHLNENPRGWSTLEFGVAVISFFIVITGFYDLVNLFRARSAAATVADTMADYLSALPKTSGNQIFQNQVETLAQNQIATIFPNARKDCTGDFCYRYQIQNVTQISTNDAIRIDFSIDFPTLMLGGRKTLRARSEKRKEINYAPSQQSEINNNSNGF